MPFPALLKSLTPKSIQFKRIMIPTQSAGYLRSDRPMARR
jgi:hypothetical protein